MKYFFIFFLVLNSLFIFSQEVQKKDSIKPRKSLIIDKSKDNPKAKNNQYRIISLVHDTVFVDTTLTIKKEYKFNFLRKDNFGLLAFANEGQTYQTLNFGYNNVSSLPEMGFAGKQFNYNKFEDVKYYSVATPLTELYFKTVMEQGQSLEANLALNISPNLNFSIGYKGLRSLGKYINTLSSTGNFVFTTSYTTTKKQYEAHFHYTDQDFLNGENGGVTNSFEFESNDPNFRDRERINVFYRNANSFFKGKRIFLDHSYKINPSATDNIISLHHQFSFENKFFEYNQPLTNASSIGASKYGVALTDTNLKDQTYFESYYNKIAVSYNSKLFGNFEFSVDDYRNKSNYEIITLVTNLILPNSIKTKLNSFEGKYTFSKDKLRGQFLVSKAFTTQTVSTIDAEFSYDLNPKFGFKFQYQNISKLPDNNKRLYNSNYVFFNWNNNFNNEKINNIKFNAKTPWFDANFQATSLNDFIYYSNSSTTQELISPKQNATAINYLSVQLNKEFKFRKFALDNSILFQEVSQDSKIVNVPAFVTRSTLYFTDFYFKKALFLQTGITANYFTKYFANEYNPVIGDFFVQNSKKIGNFPMIDLFVNGKIRQTRIFFKAEQINTLFSKRNYFATPNQPYRDFIIRFGLVWNFFQ
jgi:Putative porin